VSEDPVGISVVGVGEVEASPDRMTIDLAISPRAASVAEAASIAATKTTRLLETLAGLGVEDSRVRTSRYSINPEYDHRDGGPRLLGYRVTNSLRVTTTDLEGAGALIDAAAEVGGDDLTVDNVAYSIGDDTALRRQAREAAWETVRAQAEHVAGLAGRRLGPVLSVVERTGAEPGPVMRMAAMAESSTPIAPGSSVVRVILETRFALD
jgi:uncharacterized protein YggE